MDSKRDRRRYNTFLNSTFGPNLLAYTDGGGTENIVGVSAPCAIDGFIALFPVWPRNEPAAFQSLLVKWGVEVTAALSPATGAGAGCKLTTTPDKFQSSSQ